MTGSAAAAAVIHREWGSWRVQTRRGRSGQPACCSSSRGRGVAEAVHRGGAAGRCRQGEGGQGSLHAAVGTAAAGPEGTASLSIATICQYLVLANDHTIAVHPCYTVARETASMFLQVGSCTASCMPRALRPDLSSRGGPGISGGATPRRWLPCWRALGSDVAAARAPAPGQGCPEASSKTAAASASEPLESDLHSRPPATSRRLIPAVQARRGSRPQRSGAAIRRCPRGFRPPQRSCQRQGGPG